MAVIVQSRSCQSMVSTPWQVTPVSPKDADRVAENMRRLIDASRARFSTFRVTCLKFRKKPWRIALAPGIVP